MAKSKNVQPSKADKVKELAKRGATHGERAAAQAALQRIKDNLPAVPNEDAGDMYTCQGVVTRHHNDTKTYLRGTALAHFLNHVKDGQPFTYKNVPPTDEFGSGDFYTGLKWMLAHNLAIKHGSSYTVPSRAKVRDRWNEFVETMKL